MEAVRVVKVQSHFAERISTDLHQGPVPSSTQESWAKVVVALYAKSGMLSCKSLL